MSTDRCLLTSFPASHDRRPLINEHRRKKRQRHIAVERSATSTLQSPQRWAAGVERSRTSTERHIWAKEMFTRKTAAGHGGLTTTRPRTSESRTSERMDKTTTDSDTMGERQYHSADDVACGGTSMVAHTFKKDHIVIIDRETINLFRKRINFRNEVKQKLIRRKKKKLRRGALLLLRYA